MQHTLDLFAEPAGAADLPAEQSSPSASCAPVDNVAQLARDLYDDCQTSKPAWDQLSDVTRSVWMERATRTLAGHPRPWSIFP